MSNHEKSCLPPLIPARSILGESWDRLRCRAGGFGYGGELVLLKWSYFMSENDCLDLIDTASVVLFFALFGWFAFLHGKKSQRKTKIKFIIFIAALLGLYALIFIPCLQLDYFK